MKTAKKLEYYAFRMTSSRGTDRTIILTYDGVPPEATLRDDAETWEQRDGPKVSENLVTVRWKRLTRLPKTRAQALARWKIICKADAKLRERRAIMSALLSLPPWNGAKSK